MSVNSYYTSDVNFEFLYKNTHVINVFNSGPMFAFAQGMRADVVTLDGINPLHEACLGGHFACAKLLLEHGADVCPELREYFLVINTSWCV